MSNEPKEIRYKINKEPLFDATLSNGPHKQTLSDGITVEAHVEGGRIAGYTAYDSSGKPLPVRRRRRTDATEGSVDAAAAECMYCICGEFTCNCWVEPCLP